MTAAIKNIDHFWQLTTRLLLEKYGIRKTDYERDHGVDIDWQGNLREQETGVEEY